MKNLTNHFVAYLDNDEFMQKMAAYSRILKTKEWQFFRDALWSIKGEMAIDMFSQKHTSLPKDEKDAVQQAYFQVNQLLDFLSNPMEWAKKKTMKQKLYDLSSKVIPKQKGDKK